MKIMNKIFVFLLTVLLALQLQACASSNKNLVTDTGTELSGELTETVNFLGSVKAVYITVATVCGAAYDSGYLTVNEFSKIAKVATEFKKDLKKSSTVMLSWYDTEESKILANRNKLQEESMKLILDHLDKLIITVQETKGIAVEDRQIIDASFNTLNVVYGAGGNK